MEHIEEDYRKYKIEKNREKALLEQKRFRIAKNYEKERKNCNIKNKRFDKWLSDIKKLKFEKKTKYGNQNQLYKGY